MKRSLPIILTALAAGAVGGFFIRSAVASTPTVDPLTFTGRITQSGGTPLADGDRAVHVALRSGNTNVCETVVGMEPSVTFTDGRFAVPLPDCAATQVALHGDLEIQLNITGAGTLPWMRLGAVPYALEAKHADTATLANTAAGAVDALATRLDRVDTDMGARLKNGGWGSLAHLPLGSSNPTWGSQMMWQAGADVVVTVTKTSGAGNSMAVVNFPTAFPHGVVTVLGTFGDTGFSLANLGVLGTTTSSVTFSLDAAVGSQIRINWMAVGY